LKTLRIAIVLAFGLVLQICRAAVVQWAFPEVAPEWAFWTSIVVWTVLWFTLGNLLNRVLERMMTRKRPKP
jgi:hypothetical protein